MGSKVNIRALSKQVIERLYPATCLLCGAPGARGRELCAGCHAELPWNRSACTRCAQPLPAGTAKPAVCAQCLTHPPVFDAALAPFRYERPLDWLITGLKFHQRLGNARLLGELAADLLVPAFRKLPKQRPHLLIPVPLHESRLRQRGYNQAVELARPLARRLGVPLDLTGCTRGRATAAQMELDAKHRALNVRGAFSCTLQLRQKRVAIIDDVVTTGNTVNEFARVLKKAGAARVEVWSLARAAQLG